jgi:hypothetical protein
MLAGLFCTTKPQKIPNLVYRYVAYCRVAEKAGTNKEQKQKQKQKQEQEQEHCKFPARKQNVWMTDIASTMSFSSCARHSGLTMLAIVWFMLLFPFSSARAFASPLYINIVVVDPSNVIEGMATEKIGALPLPGPLKRLANFGASKLAPKVSPSTVAKMMSSKLPKKMTAKMKENGLTVSVEKDFQEGKSMGSKY